MLFIKVFVCGGVGGGGVYVCFTPYLQSDQAEETHQCVWWQSSTQWLFHFLKSFSKKKVQVLYNDITTVQLQFSVMKTS